MVRMKVVYVDKSVLFSCENKPLKNKIELDGGGGICYFQYLHKMMTD